MGEQADMMNNGDLCDDCGAWLGEGDGFPRHCRDCAQYSDDAAEAAAPTPSGRR